MKRVHISAADLFQPILIIRNNKVSEYLCIDYRGLLSPAASVMLSESWQWQQTHGVDIHAQLLLSSAVSRPATNSTPMAGVIDSGASISYDLFFYF